MNTDNATTQPVNRPAKILVVEDNNLVAKTLGFKLRGSGYDVVTAADGAAAMAAVRQDRPDLILLDIMFPDDFANGWDGFSIMEWLHRLGETRKTPIIIMTGSDDVSNEAKATAAGAAAFFRKPIDHEKLLNVIRSLLGCSAPKPA